MALFYAEQRQRESTPLRATRQRLPSRRDWAWRWRPTPTENLYALLAYAGVVFKIDATTGAYSTVASAGYLQYPGLPLPGGSPIVTDHGPTGAVVGSTQRAASRR